MSKKKIKISLMITLVLGVWGKIVYDIIAGTRTELNQHVVLSTPIPGNESLESIENLELQLNYRDPFLQRSTGKKIVTVSDNGGTRSAVRSKETAPVSNIVKWPEFEYLGMMKPKNREDLLAILKVGTSEFVVGKNDDVMQCKILAVYRDSVLISKESQLKTITR